MVDLKTICPLCHERVCGLRPGCHVIPRHYMKDTKINGKNILLDFNNDVAKINQTDLVGRFWCDICEARSSKEDGYGARVLKEKNEGTWSKIKKVNYSYWILSDLDYSGFKNYLVSIVIRYHLYQKSNGLETLLNDSQFDIFRSSYFDLKDEVVVTGHLSLNSSGNPEGITLPVLSQDKNGVSFKLMEYDFLLYFEKPTCDTSYFALSKKGRIMFIVMDGAGSLKDLGGSYSKIKSNPSNAKVLTRAKELAKKDSDS